MDWVFLLVFVIVGAGLALAGKERATRRGTGPALRDAFPFRESTVSRAERAARDEHDFVIALARGDTVALRTQKFSGSTTLRHIQLIGDSRQIILASKSAATRSSRLTVIERSVAELDREGWHGVPVSAKGFISEIVWDVAQQVDLRNAVDAIEKFLAASTRAKTAKTRAKYALLAFNEVESRMAAASPQVRDKLRAIRDSLIETPATQSVMPSPGS